MVNVTYRGKSESNIHSFSCTLVEFVNFAVHHIFVVGVEPFTWTVMWSPCILVLLIFWISVCVLWTGTRLAPRSFLRFVMKDELRRIGQGERKQKTEKERRRWDIWGRWYTPFEARPNWRVDARTSVIVSFGRRGYSSWLKSSERSMPKLVERACSRETVYGEANSMGMNDLWKLYPEYEHKIRGF
jgi:hypothetical protein